MITLSMLRKLKACESQCKAFAELFPRGAPLTVETAVSVASVFHWDWAANAMLTQANRAAFNKAREVPWAAYKEAIASLWAAYKEAEEAPLWAAYEEAEEAPLLAAYKEAKKALWAAYEEARARTFAELYIAQQSPKTGA